MSKAIPAAGTSTGSAGPSQPNIAANPAPMPKYFTVSSINKPLTTPKQPLITVPATVAVKSVPSLLKPTASAAVRAPQTTILMPGSTAAVRAPSTAAKTVTVAGVSSQVRFPMTFNISTSSNGKSGVIPVVLSPSSGARSGNVSLLKSSSATTTTSVGSSYTALTAAASSTATAPVKKRPRIGADAFAGFNSNISSKVEESKPSAAAKESANAESAASRRRRRTTEDGVKGLRYFATKVCDKVKEKNLTSYNAVAEDLVKEYSDPHPSKAKEEIACEQKNIRRRVYDALNVLMAINVIQKERKQIRWVGLPRSLNEAGIPKRENMLERKRTLNALRQRLFHSSLQLIGLKELAEDNKARRAAQAAAELDSVKDLPLSDAKRAEITNAVIASDLDSDESQHIHMPFLFITCNNRCEVECGVSTDAKEYELQFSEPFKIVEDTEVLRNMPLVKSLDKGEYGIDQVTKACQQLPRFMTDRFIGLLNEHGERIKKYNDSLRQQEQARAVLAVEQQKHKAHLQAMQVVLSGNLPIAPAPLKVEDGLETLLSSSYSGQTGEASSSGGTPFLPSVSVPNCAPIASSMQTGSPVTLKPAFYIQISNPNPATKLATDSA